MSLSRITVLLSKVFLCGYTNLSFISEKLLKIEFSNAFKIHELDVECKMTIRRGHITCLSGENGVGKSSFLQFLKRNDEMITQNKKAIFVDQFPLMPINKINLLELEKSLSHLNKEENNLESIKELRAYTKDFERVPINELSGGQNQLVKILVALHLNGDMYFFDEPLQYLDNTNVTRFKKILINLKEQQKNILIIEHRQELLSEIIDDHFEMTRTDKVRVQ